MIVSSLVKAKPKDVNVNGNDIKDGNAVDWKDVDYQWNVVANFDVKQTVNENKITVSVNDENLIGGSFLIGVYIGGTVVSEIKVSVIE